MAKRTKKPVIIGVTQEKAEQAFSDFAKADARISKINADMDVQITKIRDKYAEELSYLEADKERAFDILQVYSTENRDTLFTKKKSIETVYGTYGFRRSNPSLKPMKGFTWIAVANLLEKIAPAYIRKKIEADKDKLLADRETLGDKMAEYGVKVVQEETFFVERKTEEAAQ
jgi:phage host-nuclease inhibitor protein Gam